MLYKNVPTGDSPKNMSSIGIPQPNLMIFTGNIAEWDCIIPLTQDGIIYGLAIFPTRLSTDSAKFQLNRPEIINRDNIPNHFKAQCMFRSVAYRIWLNAGLKLKMELPPHFHRIAENQSPTTRTIGAEAYFQLRVASNVFPDFITTLSGDAIRHIVLLAQKHANDQMPLLYCYTHQNIHRMAEIEAYTATYTNVEIRYILYEQLADYAQTEANKNLL